MVKQTAAPATTREAVEALDRLALVAQAEHEAAAVKEAAKAKQPKPATPALDYINETTQEYREQRRNGGNGNGRTRKAAASKPQLVTRPGFASVELVKGRQAEVIGPVASKVEGAEVEAWTLLLKGAKAPQAMADALVNYLKAEAKPYPTRMGVLTLVAIRKQFPKVTTSSTSPIMRLVDALNADDSPVEAWGYDVNPDSTLAMWMQRKSTDQRDTGSVARLLDTLGVKPPSATRKATTKKAAASKKAPASKAAKPTTKGTPASKRVVAGVSGKASKQVTPLPKKSTPRKAASTTKRTAKASA